MDHAKCTSPAWTELHTCTSDASMTSLLACLPGSSNVAHVCQGAPGLPSVSPVTSKSLPHHVSHTRESPLTLTTSACAWANPASSTCTVCGALLSPHLHCNTPATSHMAYCNSCSLVSLTSLLPASSHSHVQSVLIIREIRATMRCHFPPIRLVNFKNSDHMLCWQEV